MEKKSILFLILFIFLAYFNTGMAQTIEVTVDHQHAVGTDFVFDLYIKATVGTVYLGSCDLVLQFNSGNFTGPAITAINNNSGDGSTFDLVSTSGASVGAAYEAAVSPADIISNEIILNVAQVSFTSLNFNQKVAKLTTGTLYHFGNYTLSGISNASGTMGAVWKTSGGGVTTKISTLQNVSPYNASTITLSAPAIVDAALPVELTTFTASANRLNAQIKWSTATEKNCYGFEIQRRSVETANAAWAKVGFVQGAGTSASPKQYSYTDASAAPGRYAYRLKQIDNDGGFKYSQSTEVEVGLVAKVFTLSSNYPNPFNPATTIEFTLEKDGKAVLNVYNELGQEVAELFNGEAQAGRIIQTHFDASRLSSGIYFSRLQADGKSLVKRMMLIK